MYLSIFLLWRIFKMKLLKIMAVVMALCMMVCAFVACDKGSDGGETTAAETTVKTTVEVTLIIKDGSTVKYEGTTSCNGTLGNAIEMFCAGEFEDEFEIFDSNNLLSTIGELTSGNGKAWKAYYEDEGQSKAFASIKDQALENGKTVVIVLE